MTLCLERNGKCKSFGVVLAVWGTRRTEWDRPVPRGEGFHRASNREQEFLRALIRTIGVPSSDVLDVNVYLVSNQSKYVPGTNFRAWASQVVRFRCLNYFRTMKRSPMVNLSEEVLDLIAGETAVRFGENHARLEYLGSCLAELPEDQRQLLEAVYAKRSSLKELARAKQLTHAAMRKTISRIRQALKACIESKSKNGN